MIEKPCIVTMITMYQQLSVSKMAVHELLDLPAGAYPDKAALIFSAAR